MDLMKSFPSDDVPMRHGILEGGKVLLPIIKSYFTTFRFIMVYGSGFSTQWCIKYESVNHNNEKLIL